jgi:hypothetical protein
MRPGAAGPDDPKDFIWEGFDGSRVFAHRLQKGYNTALGHNREELKKWISNRTLDTAELYRHDGRFDIRYQYRKREYYCDRGCDKYQRSTFKVESRYFCCGYQHHGRNGNLDRLLWLCGHRK